MFRRPEDRLLAAWYMEPPMGWFKKRLPDIKEYAHLAQGTYVKLLTRVRTPRNEAEVMAPPPTEQETALAAHRVKEAFVFVGLQEEWKLSVCLWHRMLGGKCAAIEFVDFNPGWGKRYRLQDGSYDLSVLKGFRDKHDGA